MPERLERYLETSAQDRPALPAIVDGSRTVPYGDLDSRANRLAWLLKELGVSRGDRVGIFLDKSAEFLIAIYAVLKAGAAYVPLDPQAPPARVAFIARDCGLRCLVTGWEKRSRWAQLLRSGAEIETFLLVGAPPGDGLDEVRATLPPGCTVIESAAVEAQPDADPPGVRVSSQDLAYVLYTSGSTGEPKGVMLTHANAVAFVRWAVEEFAVRSDDRLSSHAPLHFDLSIFDIFAAAKAGAATVLIPRPITMFPVQLIELLQRAEVTVWYSVPSALIMMLQKGGLRPGCLPAVRTVLFAGEVLPTKFLRALMAYLPGVRFANLYGPTETNVCTWYEVPTPLDETVPIPIGKPIFDTNVFVIADDGRLAGAGQVGELYVQGPTVTPGYWDDTERSRDRLVLHPCAPRAEPAYRTGDYGWSDAAGDLHLVGRRDAQVKTRGYRVELGDVEAAIHSSPGVVDCAVVAVPDELVTNRLVAVVVGDGCVQSGDVTRFCSQRLPSYMIPEAIEFRSTLPKTSTGKTDRRRLTEELGARASTVDKRESP